MKKSDNLDEVYTEKQRRWACHQMDSPKSERKIPKEKATEMCKDVKHSKKKNENVKPKMKKGALVEYINSKKNITESSEPKIVREINRTDFTKIVRWIEKLKESGLINMLASAPLLSYTESELNRWLYGKGSDVESIESEIKILEYDNDEGENDSEIENLEKQKECIQFLLENKDSIRDILIRASLKRVENNRTDFELDDVQRVFNRMSKEVFIMWMSIVYG